MGQLISRFLKHVVPGVIRPLHILWNEVIGFLFLVFAVMAGFYVFRALREFDGELEDVFRVALPGLFALVMAYFGISSFLRARKISRS